MITLIEKEYHKSKLIYDNKGNPLEYVDSNKPYFEKTYIFKCYSYEVTNKDSEYCIDIEGPLENNQYSWSIHQESVPLSCGWSNSLSRCKKESVKFLKSYLYNKYSYLCKRTLSQYSEHILETISELDNFLKGINKK